MSFVHLHTHSEFSLLDSMSKITEIPKLVKELGMESIALTDHGNMLGAVKFYKACKSVGIKPIIGCEVYTAERTLSDKDSEKDRAIGHLVLLCKNETGYHNLIKIVSKAYRDGFYYKPRTDKNELAKYNEGLICLSGCLAGKVQRLLIQDKYEEAKEEALELKAIFGEDFYLEIQDHGQEEDKKAIEGGIKLSKELNIPLVATNDSHYLRKTDAKVHEVMLCMQTNGKIDDENHFRFSGPEYYIKSEDEMRDIFSYIPEACDNTVKIAEQCNFDFEMGTYHIPSYQVPEEFKDSEKYFKHLCYEGIKKKYEKITPEIEERLEFEINTIIQMGFVEYFLIVWDFINYAKRNNIPVGPGRGSAAGSIVAYSLSITEIDPIKYALYFERFLNPARVTMPDIDVDFCIKRRGEVIQYVTEKYGSDCVSQIATLGTMKAKAAVKDVARVLDVPFIEANRLSKLIPDDATLSEALELSEDLRHEYETSPQSKTVIDFALNLEGLSRHVSTHAAGVVVAPQPLANFVPLIETKAGPATQFTMTEIEELGLLKMDFLGLRNLTVINDTLNMIERNYGTRPDMNKLSFDDPEVFDLISKGKTVGVFQLESKGITDFMKKLKPSKFEDIIAGVALYRPGPMDNIPQYIKNKRHPDQIEYLTPELASILDVTYGIIVYQEQVMNIVQKLAGYSFARADLVRRAMSKKKADVMEQEREYFINGKLDEDGNIEIPGCIRNGISKEAANKIYDEMISFAAYAFNKSHATAYSVLTYQTAWLKNYYPAEFMAALMSSEENNLEHIETFIKEAKKMSPHGETKKLKILPPSVNDSMVDFDASGEYIRFGFSAIKGVGRNVAERIVEAREMNNGFSSIVNFFQSVDVSSTVAEALASTGAFNGLNVNVATSLANYEHLLASSRTIRQKRSKGQISIFDVDEELSEEKELDIKAELPKEQLLAYEKNYLGTYVTGHPLRKYKSIIRENASINTAELEEGASGITAGMITEVKDHISKKGDKMAFFSFDDIDDNNIECVIFPRAYTQNKKELSVGAIVAMEGNVKDDSFIINKILPIDTLELLGSRNKQKKNHNMLKLKFEQSKLDAVWKILKKYPGDIEVRWYESNDKAKILPLKVREDRLMFIELETIIGEGNVKFAS